MFCPECKFEYHSLFRLWRGWRFRLVSFDAWPLSKPSSLPDLSSGLKTTITFWFPVKFFIFICDVRAIRVSNGSRSYQSKDLGA